MGEGRVGKDLALGRRFAAGHEDLGETRLVLESGNAARPATGDHLWHRCTLAGELRRRSQDILDRQPAELTVKLEPAVSTAGDRPRVGRVDRDGAVLFRGHLVDGQRRRRAAGGVESVELFGLGVPDHGEEVATEAVGCRFQKSEGRVDGNRSVDR